MPINPWLAALGAGLSQAGEDITTTKRRKEDEQAKEDAAKLASDRALAMLIKGKQIDNDNENIYGEKYNIDTTDETGAKVTRAVHDNKRTGQTEYVDVVEPGTKPPVVPSADAAMSQLTGAPRVPLLRKAGDAMPPEVPSVPNVPPPVAVQPPERVGSIPQLPDDVVPPAVQGSGPPPPVAPAVPQDTTPKKRTFTVTPKAPAQGRASPQRVMVDGVPAVVMMGGGLPPTTAQGQPITGKITPYVPPVRPGSAAGLGGGFGAGGIAGAGRTISGIAGLHNAHENMVTYENDVASGKAKFDGLDYYKKLQGQMYDEKGIINPAVHATVMANLGATNPDLANYLQSAEMWALEDASISNRPSDFRTKLDGFVSAMKPNQNQKGIEQMQHGRQVRLEGLDLAVPALKAQLSRVAGIEPGAAPPATATTAKKSISKAEYDALKSQGFSDAVLKAKYTITP